MEDKHTPGPWFVVEYAGFWNLQADPYYTDEGDLLDQEHYAAAEANAKLAAAAPDLLAAARIAASGLMSTEPGYKELMDAIYKATL
jgi:hypothetical protein